MSTVFAQATASAKLAGVIKYSALMSALFIHNQCWMTVLAILIRRWSVYKERKHPNFFNLRRNVQLSFSLLDVTSHALCTTILCFLYNVGQE